VAGAIALNSHPRGEWVARIARTLGGFVGAVLVGMLLAGSDAAGFPAMVTGLSRSAQILVAAVVGLAIGLPLAYGTVLALGWNESRPTWPLVGFILGSEVASALLIVAIRVDGAGAPSQADLAWWAACTSALVLGAFGAFGVIQRRHARVASAPSGRAE